MPAPLLAAAGAVAARALGGMAARKAGGSMLARGAASGATQFGLGALMGGGAPKRQDHGVTQWARENPGEAAVAGTAAIMRSAPLAQSAGDSYQAVIQSAQFGQR